MEQHLQRQQAKTGRTQAGLGTEKRKGQKASWLHMGRSITAGKLLFDLDSTYEGIIVMRLT
jgi:hypothetical protein